VPDLLFTLPIFTPPILSMNHGVIQSAPHFGRKSSFAWNISFPRDMRAAMKELLWQTGERTAAH
jgi:hypothetical protein